MVSTARKTLPRKAAKRAAAEGTTKPPARAGDRPGNPPPPGGAPARAESALSPYEAFVASKQVKVLEVGFKAKNLPAALFPWQQDLVAWACRLGRAALFEDCGLGKGFQLLAWAQQVCRDVGGGASVLVLAPLAAAGEILEQGQKFGIPVAYAAEQAEVRPGITVTNYERAERFDPKYFAGVVLDESSILKSFMGKTKRYLCDAFAETPYRLCCTATPAPNDVMELGNHSEFLGLMPSSEMLTRWFINDTKESGTYRLKRHAEADFWRWVASWAACVTRPSDLGHSDEGYELPGLEVVEHVVEGPKVLPSEGGDLFGIAQVNATTLHRQLRRTIPARAARAAELVRAEPGEPWVLWVNTNDEADALLAALPEALEVRGDQPHEEKERKLRAFSRGEARVMITKSSIAGFGLNWQHCARHAYVGINYSFEDFYQAIRRSYRFGQTRPVRAHVIVSGGEVNVRGIVRAKQEAHRRQQVKLSAAMREVRLAEVERLRPALAPPPPKVEQGHGWELYLGDCVEVARGLPSNSVHFGIHSPPFSSLYTYSASLRDMGNCASDEEFFQHYGFLIPELLRITVPGRLCAVHTKDLTRYKNATGASGLRDFTGEVRQAFEGCPTLEDGSRWVYHCKVTIWKDPVLEMQKTKSHGLLYKTLRNDASYSRVGCPDYLTLFRKWTPGTDSAEPVRHSRDEWPLERWQQVASPCWTDIDVTDVLNVQAARSDQDEKHICPLQLGLIRRAMELWTNPGDLCFDPFMGIGSTGVVAAELGRRSVGSELKPEYFRQAVGYLRTAAGQLDLFRQPAAPAPLPAANDLDDIPMPEDESLEEASAS